MEEDNNNKNPKILIVEDDPELGKTLSDVLEAKGYSPIAVLTGKKGIAVAKEEDISLALLDLKLSDISGIEVLKEIKKISPRTEAIILTAFASLDTATEAVNMGAFSYLQKPYDMERLLLNIRRALERRWAEEKIRTLAEIHTDLRNHAPIAIVNVYRDYHVDCTDRLLEWTGWSREEMEHINLVKESRFVNASGNEVVLPPLVAAEMIEKTEKDYIPKLMRGETLEGVYQCYNRKDGGTVPLELNSVGYFGGKEPKPENFVHTICIFSNITERKRAEDEVKKSYKFLETVIDNIPDTVTIRDSQQRFVLVNQAYCDIRGQTKEEVIGKTAYWEKDKEVFQTGKGLDIPERSYTDLKGKRHYVSVKKAPLTDESGKTTHVLTISRDITEHKRAEEKVKEAYRLREYFLKETSHRIITPVAIIGGNTDLLLERGNLDDDQKEKIRIIRERNEEVQKLTRDALSGKYLKEEEEGDGQEDNL